MQQPWQHWGIPNQDLRPNDWRAISTPSLNCRRRPIMYLDHHYHPYFWWIFQISIKVHFPPIHSFQPPCKNHMLHGSVLLRLVWLLGGYQSCLCYGPSLTLRMCTWERWQLTWCLAEFTKKSCFWFLKSCWICTATHKQKVLARWYLAKWFSAHEAAGRYLTDADIALFKECCDTWVKIVWFWILFHIYNSIFWWRIVL